MKQSKLALRMLLEATECDQESLYRESDAFLRIASVVGLSRRAENEETVQDFPEDHMSREQLERLIEAVGQESSFKHSAYHGDQHWRCVSMVGSRLAKQEGLNPLLPFLFGLFHDSMRENDDDDPEHGSRGAELAMEMYHRGLLPISEEMLSKLVDACQTHTEAPATYDPHRGVCYDADRLNLWRVGIEPLGKYISTDAGLWSCRQQDTNGLHHAPLGWNHVLDDHYGVQSYDFTPGQYGYFEDHFEGWGDDEENDWDD